MLTPRQNQLLAYAASGMRAHEIAAKEFIELTTVNTTLTQAKARLRAKNLPHAVAIAISYGYLEVDHQGVSHPTIFKYPRQAA